MRGGGVSGGADSAVHSDGPVRRARKPEAHSDRRRWPAHPGDRTDRSQQSREVRRRVRLSRLVGEGPSKLAKERSSTASIRLSPSRRSFRMTLSPQLLAILVCPKCKGPLEYRETEPSLVCHHCRLRYPVRDDIPIMLLDEATPV